MEQEETQEKPQAVNQEFIVELFNAFYRKGYIVKYRTIADDESSTIKLTVKSEAFIQNGIPVASFEEKEGYCSIEPEYLEYPPFHICYRNVKKGCSYNIIQLTEKEAEDYSGDCWFDDDDDICRWCGDPY
jgi:hypothetical protein